MAEDNYLEELEDKINNIPVYQGGVEEVSEQLDKRLKLVDTGNQDKFISGVSLKDLRVKAYRLGADVIVNYQYSFHYMSAFGTPVKYVD